MKEKILQYADEAEERIIQIRRRLHQYPELAMQEHKTSKIIAEELGKIEGIQVFSGLARGTGVMGVLTGGRPGKCTLLRADIDALPIQETNDLPFKSVHEGRMHACGHDAHAAWLLGSAMILSRLREEVPGTVKFVFQPGEERGRGAGELIEEDQVLANPTVDRAFAAHAWPSIEAGKIGIARRCAFGCVGGFHIVVTGKGGHGSWPHLAVNPIMISSHICMMLPQIISSRIDEVEPRVISVGALHGGEAGVGNIIPEACSIDGTIRATKKEILYQLAAEIENTVKYCCDLYGAKYEYSYYMGTAVVENDKNLVEVCKACAQEVLGQGNAYIIEKDNLGGENFSEFSKRIPSVYMYVGIKNEKLAKEFSLHSQDFMLDESVLKKAAATFAGLVFEQ